MSEPVPVYRAVAARPPRSGRGPRRPHPRLLRLVRPARDAVGPSAGGAPTLAVEAGEAAAAYEAADPGPPSASSAPSSPSSPSSPPSPPSAPSSGLSSQRVLAGLDTAVAAAGGLDLDGLDDRTLLEHTVALDEQITRLQAARAAGLRAIDRRQAYRHDACVTAASWWRMRTRRDPGPARRHAHTAARLARFPGFVAALAAGQITLDHADTLVRFATPGRLDALADHEDTLLRLARDATPKDLATACSRIADVVDPDGAGAPPGRHPRRELFHARTIDGLGDLRGLLDPVTGERLNTLLDAFHTHDPAEVPDTERRTPAQARHDAFDAILKAAEAWAQTNGGPTVQGATPHVGLFIDLYTLLGRPDLATRTTRLASGTPIDLATALALLADAKLTPILSLGPYRPVAFGRTRRVIPDWLRPALAMIHTTCAGPGCDRPVAWTQAAHSHGDWHAGADTDLDHTLPLCPGHHALLDRAGWHVHHDPDTATCTWTSPHATTHITTHPPDP